MATSASVSTALFQKGQKVQKALTGAGFTTREKAKVLRVDEQGVWLNNGPGNDPSGPFDPVTGVYLDTLCAGFTQKIEP